MADPLWRPISFNHIIAYFKHTLPSGIYCAQHCPQTLTSANCIQSPTYSLLTITRHRVKLRPTSIKKIEGGRWNNQAPKHLSLLLHLFLYLCQYVIVVSTHHITWQVDRQVGRQTKRYRSYVNSIQCDLVGRFFELLGNTISNKSSESILVNFLNSTTFM